MSKLQDLYYEHGQSPWLDNLRRGWITGGDLARWVERGVRGITSNPTIFQKAISASDEYDAQFGELIASRQSIDHVYWSLVTADIEDALSILRPVHDESAGVDGYVSVEVAPDLARWRRPASCTSASTSPTCSSRCRPPPRASRPSASSSARGTASTSRSSSGSTATTR
jgi:hypothetical protein